MTKHTRSIQHKKHLLVYLFTSCCILLLAYAISHFQLSQSPAEAAGQGWITSCNYSHSLADDPIVAPGIKDAAHLHDFFAMKSTNAFTTAADLLKGNTNCLMMNDKSAYWVPAMFKNATRVYPSATDKNILVYYRRAGIHDGTPIQTIPGGLKMIIGSAKASSPDQNPGIRSGHIQFKCGPGSGTDKPTPPLICASGVMVISYEFPNCWDGKNLDSSDHISHMSYPMGGKCPASHPVAIPRIKPYIRYPVGMMPIGNITFSSGPYYTAHMDFFNGWDPQPLQKLIDVCLNGSKDCGKNPAVPQ